MNLELEALIKAYDAAIQSQGRDSERLKAIYESLLSNALERHPNVSVAAWVNMLPIVSSCPSAYSPFFAV